MAMVLGFRKVSLPHIGKFNEFYVFTLQSVRHILNSTSVDKVTYCIKNNASEKADSESFIDTLHSICNRLFRKIIELLEILYLSGNKVLIYLKGMKVQELSLVKDLVLLIR